MNIPNGWDYGILVNHLNVVSPKKIKKIEMYQIEYGRTREFNVSFEDGTFITITQPSTHEYNYKNYTREIYDMLKEKLLESLPYNDRKMRELYE